MQLNFLYAYNDHNNNTNNNTNNNRSNKITM